MFPRGRNTLVGVTVLACLAAHSSEASQISGISDSGRAERIYIHGVEDTGTLVDGYIDLTLADSTENSETFLFSGELVESPAPGYRDAQRGIWEKIAKVVK